MEVIIQTVDVDKPNDQVEGLGEKDAPQKVPVSI